MKADCEHGIVHKLYLHIYARPPTCVARATLCVYSDDDTGA